MLACVAPSGSAVVADRYVVGVSPVSPEDDLPPVIDADGIVPVEVASSCSKAI